MNIFHDLQANDRTACTHTGMQNMNGEAVL